MDADSLIAELALKPHPEGGHFRETFRDEAGPDGRSRSTLIYFLLKAGEVSHWHRVDAVEIWHFHAGGPLEILISAGDHGPVTRHVLGTALLAGEAPQCVVPKDHWQAARPLGAFTLVSCTVAPGFDFSGFQLAPKGWSPS